MVNCDSKFGASELIAELRPESVWDYEEGWYKTEPDWSDSDLDPAELEEDGAIPEPCLDGNHGEVKQEADDLVIVESGSVDAVERFLERDGVSVPVTYEVREASFCGVWIELRP